MCIVRGIKFGEPLLVNPFGYPASAQIVETLTRQRTRLRARPIPSNAFRSSLDKIVGNQPWRTAAMGRICFFVNCFSVFALRRMRDEFWESC